MNPDTASTSGLSGNQLPEREFRWHPLLGQWVIISASTSKRPWSGAASKVSEQPGKTHDAGCYLCPGVSRSNGSVNPDYTGPYAFDNDYPALSGNLGPHASDPVESKPTLQALDTALKLAAPTSGRCRVLCWNERHDLTLADLPEADMLAVVKLWQEEYATHANDPAVAHIVMFENKGEEVGASNPHPHGQLYALPFVSETACRMRSRQAAFAKGSEGRTMLETLLGRDEYSSSTDASLLVEEGNFFKTIVPYFARFAYETWIIPLQHAQAISEFSEQALIELAQLYQRQARRYDRLFERRAPNITLLHNAPCDGHQDNRWFSFHIAMQPPLREPDKLKFLAGFESGAGNIVNPLLPEMAAAQLRHCNIE